MTTPIFKGLPKIRFTRQEPFRGALDTTYTARKHYLRHALRVFFCIDACPSSRELKATQDYTLPTPDSVVSPGVVLENALQMPVDALFARSMAC
jgi:hypothetical protein